jgi:hypothetical protein
MTSTGASSNILRQNPRKLWSYITGKFDFNREIDYKGHENLTKSGEDDTEFAELCENCTRLDLKYALRIHDGFFYIGPLAHYSCPACPFCALVWDSVSLRWGPENPLVPHNEEQSLYTSRDSEYVSLYIAQRPPGFSGPGLSEFYLEEDIFLIADWEIPHHGLPCLITQLIKRNTIQSRLDTVLLRRLLGGCTDHDLCRNRHLEKRIFLPGFRLIDVYEARLVEITDPCEYFALSYVWGGSQNTGLQTTKRNLDSLRQPSALSRENQNHEERLPLTISDAIDLCRNVGQRYLWVDCLCIVQDDLEEKMRLIHGMGQVYENASLTIFAVSGSNADHGLSGVRARKILRRERIYPINTKAGTVTLKLARLPLESQIEKSHWNTRGWTYQEQALSERRLYLTAEEAFFVCREVNWREGYQKYNDMPQTLYEGSSLHTEIPDKPFDAHFVRVPDRKDGGPSNWRSFTSAVSVYTRKDLSYPEDALYAFSGIYDRFTSIGHADPGIIATQGNHLSSFPFSLLWYGVHDGVTKTGRRAGIHDVRLSSWSWASRIGPVEFVSLDETESFNKTDFVTRNSRRCWLLCERHHSFHCLVDRWLITHLQRDAIIRTNLSTPPFRSDHHARPFYLVNVLDQSYVKEQFDTKEQLLSIFPDKPQLCERHTEMLAPLDEGSKTSSSLERTQFAASFILILPMRKSMTWR